jgi:hypothetical protein
MRGRRHTLMIYPCSTRDRVVCLMQSRLCYCHRETPPTPLDMLPLLLVLPLLLCCAVVV